MLHLLNSAQIAEIIKEIKQKCGDDVPLSTHFIETASDSWESVAAYDPSFEHVECLESSAAFSEKIRKSRELTGLDVATYILSKTKCTHLSLEKLVYFAYADYLCAHNGCRLFEDKIYAFKYGPVVDSVYEAYKRSSDRFVEPPTPENDDCLRTDVKEMPAKSRILFAKDGAGKLQSIDMTLQKYGRFTVGALVDLTHRPGSPWSYADSTKEYELISDELILAHHHAECVL